MTPRVSIICVTYGRRDYALRCIQSCIEQDYPNFEVLAFVNPSEDGTEEAIATRFPQVRLIRAHRNIGFFPGINLSIANATGEYIMTVDDDAYFLSGDAIGRLVEVFRHEPGLGAVTCNLEGPTEIPISGADRYVHLYTTGFTMIPRRIFANEVGYYPDLFSGGESFMCADLWDRGYRVKRVVDVRMYHARTMDGRYAAWVEDSVRTQALYSIMREPFWIVLPSLAAKFFRTLAQLTQAGRPGPWLWTWLRIAGDVPSALRNRRPIRWCTQRKLWRLRREVITDPGSLEEASGP